MSEASPARSSNRGAKFFGGILIVLIVIGVVIAFVFRGQVPAPAPAVSAQTVTITGDDGAGGTIDPINVWDNYQTRGAVVARVHPGDKVTLIRREGNGVEIQTADGKRGWVTFSFIKELR